MTDNESKIEELLKRSADFEAGQVMPPDLIENSVQRCYFRSRRIISFRSAQTAGWVMGLSAVAVSCVIAYIHKQPTAVAPIRISSATLPPEKSFVTVPPCVKLDAGHNSIRLIPTKADVPTTLRDAFVNTKPHLHHSSRSKKSSIPKAHWKVEKMQRYASGIITPALLAHQENGEEGVVLTPVMMDIPLDGNGSIHPVSYSPDDH